MSSSSFEQRRPHRPAEPVPYVPGPSHTTHTSTLPNGTVRLYVDDEAATTIEVATPEPGRVSLRVFTRDDEATVTVAEFTVTALVDVLRRVTGADTPTPLPGGRNFPRTGR